MSIIEKFLEKNRQSQAKIAVLGDVMVDEYYDVEVKRISPEAPIPVMRSDDAEPKELLPGGAANVAYQFHNWNVECQLYAMARYQDITVFQDNGIENIYCSGPKAAPRKKRFQSNHGLIRGEVEGKDVIYEDIDFKYIFEQLEKNLKEGLDVVILSDYGKGFFQHFRRTQDIITLCHTYGVKTIVDPKNEPVEKWVGCDVFKPNSIEAERFTDVAEPRFQCQKLAEKLDSTGIVVTYGGDGVYGIENAEPFRYRPNLDVEVASVVGAGDCFASHFALAIAHGFSLPEATEIAYKAGAVYVQRNHNKPVHAYELAESKFIHPQDLKNRDFKLVVTNGCFDLMHPGHLSSLEFAKKHGDKLAVLINSDKSVRALKGKSRPICPLEQRKQLIAGLECVDFVLDFDETSPYNLIDEIKPEVLVKGGLKTTRSAKLVKEFYTAPIIEGISTSEIIKKIKDEN
jgi:D-beta-D-heptose 7-phosphate kinase/D-beta-D-heptose 1-phosphate adenosyltransferase